MIENTHGKTMEIDKDFIIETNDLLDEAESSLLSYSPGDDFENCYKSVFRVLHSIKGAAGMYGLTELQTHLHTLETQLEDIHHREKLYSSEIIDYFLKGIDISKTILEQNDVSFSYEEFQSILKKSKTAPKSQDPAHKKIQKSEKDLKDIPKPEKKESQIEQANGTIFVVDDEVAVSTVLESILVDYNFSVEAFNDPKDLLKRLEKVKPDLILSDFNMPGMTGLELYAQIKETMHLKIPLVLISGYITKTVLLQAYDLGVSGVLEKPADPNQIVSKCIDCVAQKRALKALDSAIKHMISNFAELEEFLISKGKTKMVEAFREELNKLVKERDEVMSFKF